MCSSNIVYLNILSQFKVAHLSNLSFVNQNSRYTVSKIMYLSILSPCNLQVAHLNELSFQNFRYTVLKRISAHSESRLPESEFQVHSSNIVYLSISESTLSVTIKKCTIAL